MKTLLLMRHAKSSWKDSKLPDHERPLNKRGSKDAPEMGKLLFKAELVPQVILCSSAKRARLTAEAVVEQSNFRGEVTYLDSFYLAEPETYLKGLQDLPDEIERVMVIGHNPGLEGLLQILCRRVESLPTASIAYLALPIKQWSELNDSVVGELVQLWKPRELKEAKKEKKQKKK
jgi:phosphohistidine phosphatase